MKKRILFVLITVLILTMQPTYASSAITTVEYLEDGSRYVTIIEDAPSNSMQTYSYSTVTKSKTTYYVTDTGEKSWWVKVTGTFTYGSGTSKCISVTPSAEAIGSSWRVSNISGSKSGNKANATATGKQYYSGSVIDTRTKTVTLTCSPTGVFS